MSSAAADPAEAMAPAANKPDTTAVTASRAAPRRRTESAVNTEFPFGRGPLAWGVWGTCLAGRLKCPVSIEES
ncbi:hypothetical protein SCWH03_02470 [Streptomyces pacificus]|uniref:Uncharacterized protein n=1 Tax=Streptomyces pacificus TaxID=2705029 RepID=A0A6A0AP93_9ACTN|nr:hypothetical protein SCWH03_02470 [Streptomyces pacificus]